MQLIKAKLIKLTTEDELVRMEDDVTLGREYIIDIDSKREVKMFNFNKDVYHHKVIVDVSDGTWFPIELLELNI